MPTWPGRDRFPEVAGLPAWASARPRLWLLVWGHCP
jgi:hypothetical protein